MLCTCFSCKMVTCILLTYSALSFVFEEFEEMACTVFDVYAVVTQIAHKKVSKLREM